MNIAIAYELFLAFPSGLSPTYACMISLGEGHLGNVLAPRGWHATRCLCETIYSFRCPEEVSEIRVSGGADSPETPEAKKKEWGCRPPAIHYTHTMQEMTLLWLPQKRLIADVDVDEAAHETSIPPKQRLIDETSR